jgi:mutator protein MutT
MRIVVTGGAIIRDPLERILFQKRSDYGNWGLPGGGMVAGESIEETMKREVYEETGLVVTDFELYTVYSGEKMQYKYPDGNEVVFVQFIFNAKADLTGKLAEDGRTLLFQDTEHESLRLEFIAIEDIKLEEVSTVQQPLIHDLKSSVSKLLRV